MMEMLTPQLILSFITVIGGLIGVWVSLNNKIVRMEKDVESLSHNNNRSETTIQKIQSEMQTILQVLARIEEKLKDK
jgi:prefoldin subunit 5